MLLQDKLALAVSVIDYPVFETWMAQHEYKLSDVIGKTKRMQAKAIYDHMSELFTDAEIRLLASEFM